MYEILLFSLSCMEFGHNIKNVTTDVAEILLFFLVPGKRHLQQKEKPSDQKDLAASENKVVMKVLYDFARKGSGEKFPPTVTLPAWPQLNPDL